MKAITVTFNPSFDTTLFCDGLHRDKANRVLDEITEAGGKGINVARVIDNLGVNTVAFCLVGSDDADKFGSLLKGDYFRLVKREGKTRENLTLRNGNECMKINRKGERVSEQSLAGFENEVLSFVEEGDIVVISGSMPIGYDKSRLCDFCKKLDVKGARIVLDTDIDERLINEIKPFMIKPNEYEITDIVGETDSLNTAALKCYEAGVQNVIITLGEKGMLVRNKDGEYLVFPKKIEPKSTVGAGDSAVAGFVAGVILGMEYTEILALSAASGTATAMCEGTGLADSPLIQEVKKATKVVKNK
ncbi:MAG: 1-phosphofructokinase family hexose kinase [Clostridia bacterium]|nr:1-phosphofructokinase family hexose kinase [Clostridia bacterium]